MNNTYRDLMGQQSMSDQAKQRFYRNLEKAEQKKPASFLRNFAVAAAYVLLLIPVTAYAVGNIFGVSVVEIVKGNTATTDTEHSGSAQLFTA